MEKIKVAAIQMPTLTDKMQNVRTAGIYLEKIKDEKPDFVILPEMFCCPYQTQNFPVYAEEEGGPVWQQLSEYAKQYGIYLIGGSMPEKDAEGKVYNTSYIFDRQGKQIGKHRKVHLFDILVFIHKHCICIIFLQQFHCIIHSKNETCGGESVCQKSIIADDRHGI